MVLSFNREEQEMSPGLNSPDKYGISFRNLDRSPYLDLK